MTAAEVHLIRARTAADILRAACPPDRPADAADFQRAAFQIILEFLDSLQAVSEPAAAPPSRPEPETPAKRPSRRTPRKAKTPTAESPEETEEDRKDAVAAAVVGVISDKLLDDWKAMKKAIGKISAIPEAIEAVTAAGFTQTRLGTVLGLDPAAISRAAAGQIYPYVERAFKRRFQIPPAEGGENISRAEARLKAIHED